VAGKLIESGFAHTASWTRRVKRWRDAKMAMRWGAAALWVACLRATHRQAEQGFRRVQGYQYLAELILALEQRQKNLAPLKRAA
jgi:hypothetical protein